MKRKTDVLKLILKAYPRPLDHFDISLQSIVSAGEAVGTRVFARAHDTVVVTINERFGQTEMNDIVGNSNSEWPAKPGSMGGPYPGQRVAVIDENGGGASVALAPIILLLIVLTFCKVLIESCWTYSRTGEWPGKASSKG